MTKWRRLVREAKRALAVHHIAACRSIDAAARELGMTPSTFRRTLKRLR